MRCLFCDWIDYSILNSHSDIWSAELFYVHSSMEIDFVACSISNCADVGSIVLNYRNKIYTRNE
jgi:hypothetical protein